MGESSDSTKSSPGGRGRSRGAPGRRGSGDPAASATIGDAATGGVLTFRCEGVEIALPPAALPVDWSACFGRSAPLVLEIGTGNGRYMAVEAARRQEEDFIGIERCPEFFEKFRRRIERAGLANVRCIMAEAEEVIDRMIAPGSLDRVICLHSDPWPKRRHRLRRVFRDDFMERFERILVPGGVFEFQHDVGWYFNLTVHLFRSRGGWSFLEIGPVAPPGDAEGTQTNFEARARAQGTRIWGFKARWEGRAE